MAYTKYSLTPANNNAAPPDGAPEGMLPSAVNDTMRDMMAQIRDVGDGIRGGTYTMTAPVITGGSIAGVSSVSTTALTSTNDASISGLTVGKGANAVSQNTAVGGSALASGSLSGDNNTGIGYLALSGNTSGADNTAVGRIALLSNTTGVNNTAVGGNALYLNTTGTQNTGVGQSSLTSNATGNFNTAYGSSSLAGNTTGASNTGIGQGALAANTTASGNTAVGYQAGYSNTTGTDIVAMGYQALFSNSTGATNNAFGKGALQANTTASYNNAFGTQALLANTTGAANCSFGHQSLLSNTTGSTNMAFGGTDLATGAALQANTTGSSNNAFGAGALKSNTTGNYNSAVGHQALNANTTASYNTAVGYQALLSTTTGSGRNTAVGYFAGQSLTTGTECVFIGDYAGQTTTGSSNTFLGRAAGYLTTTGTVNTFVGNSSGSSITTGSKNTIIGAYTGNQGGLDIRTASNYIVLSDGDGNPRQVIDSSGNCGIGTSSPDTLLTVENASTHASANIRCADGYNSTLAFSDASGNWYEAYVRYLTDVNAMAFAVNDAERMRIDSSGNVGIGTSSPAQKFNVSDGTTTLLMHPTGGIGFTGTYSNHPLAFTTNNVERMRIDSSGRLLVGTTTPLNTSYRLSVTGSAGGSWTQGSNSGDATVVAESKGSSWNFYGINSAGANTFYVLANGDVRNTNNSYGAISDAKLKENIVDATPKLEDLLKVKIRHYNLIGDSSKQIGVVAQELEQVFPKLVETNVGMTTELDPNPEPTKSVKYSVFVPMLIKAIQEQQVMINELKAKVAALEAA